MADAQLNTGYRYPGIRSFERAEAGQFFGRSREIAELYSLVKVKPLTVLFAKSGIGKTSLLNAGLIPLLETGGFQPVKIRLQDRSLAPVETVKKVLEPFLDSALLEKYGTATPTLWEYIRACRFTGAGESATPVLLFDQFEELFMHLPGEQEALTQSLADLINERLPDRVQEAFRRFPRQARSDELLGWFSPLRIRVVFAIRTDRMGELDRLKRHIPTVLHDRYYLQPLQHDAAREAILLPAALHTPADNGPNTDLQPGFRTPPFTYSEAALAVMLSALDNENGEVESFQLQLLCRHIENLVEQQGLDMVQPDTFGGSAGIGAILNDYYEREIGGLDPAEQITARRFIEEGLIDNGHRVGIPAGAEQSRFGVGPGLLDKLLNSRLIRAEVIHLGTIYELSHDTLVEPVVRSYEKRRVEEERRRAAQALAEERARLAELAKKRRRARSLAIAGFALAAMALIGGFFAWRNAQAAQRARRAADVSALAAKAWSIYRDDHTLAFRIAQAALTIDSTNADARQTLANILDIPTTTFYQSVLSVDGSGLDVTALHFSPDNELVASGYHDGNVRIWKRASGRLLVELSEEAGGHADIVNDVRFSPDGQSVFSAGRDGRVLQINLAGEVLQDFQAHRSINSMDIDADGQRLVTGSNDSAAVIWSIDGRRLTTLRGHNGIVRAADFSADGRFILTGSDDGTARLWNAVTGTSQQVYRIGAVKVNAAALAPDGQSVLLGCSDRTARLFSRTGAPIATISGHSAEVVKVAFAPDGRRLFTASGDHTAKMWSIEGEELLKLVGHTERLASLAVSPDGNWVATGGFDFLAKVWNIPFNLQKVAARHAGPVFKAAVSSDGKTILSASEDNTAKVWDLQGMLLHTLDGHRGWVNAVAISPDDQYYLSGSNDGTVKIWRPDGQLVRTTAKLPGSVYAVAFSPDGQRILVGAGREIWLLDTAGRAINHWQAHPRQLKSAVFAPDGQSILSAGTEGVAKTWTLQGQLTDSIVNEDVRFQYAVFSPAGDKIVSVGAELPVRIWDKKGNLLNTLFGHQNENYHVAFSPDGASFAVSGWDKTVRTWSMDGRLLHTLPHPDGVYGAAYTPDGKSLITACRDKLMRVWAAPTGQLVRVIGGQPDPKTYLYDDRIAALPAIPFSPERYGISSAEALQICGASAAQMAGMGIHFLQEGVAHHSDDQTGLEYFEKAEVFFQKGRVLTKGLEQTRFDSLLAETWAGRAYHHLLNRRVPGFLQAAQAGLKHQDLPKLRLYLLLARMAKGRDEAARQEALAMCRDTITPLGDYTNFREAFSSEADYILRQLGVDSPELKTLLEELE